MLRLLGLLLLTGLILPRLPAQQSWPLKISLIDHSLSIPTTWFLGYGVDPGLMLGTEYRLKEKGGHQLYLSGNLGLYYQARVETGLFLQVDIAYRYQWKRWYAGLGLGPGYAHTFFTTPEYRYADGTFSPAPQNGRPHIVLAGGVELGYQLGEKPESPRLSFVFREQIHSPLTFYNGFHQLVGLSCTFFPFVQK